MSETPSRPDMGVPAPPLAPKRKRWPIVLAVIGGLVVVSALADSSGDQTTAPIGAPLSDDTSLDDTLDSDLFDDYEACELAFEGIDAGSQGRAIQSLDLFAEAWAKAEPGSDVETAISELQAFAEELANGEVSADDPRTETVGIQLGVACAEVGYTG